MELWGAALYGDPCRECGFDWAVEPEDALSWMQGVAGRFASATDGASGSLHLGGWSVAEYVSHVADNLRQWAERIQAARLAGRTEAVGYDPDALAAARSYATIPLPVALWSLRLSSEAWVAVLRPALADAVELDHTTRGRQRAEDVVRNNTHDAHHHLWDVARILAGAGEGPVA